MTRADRPAGVILMAYGAPGSLDDVGDFFTDIRGGHRPPEERIEELKGRYRAIGGGEALLRITTDQARELQRALDGDGGERVAVFFGMRHARPFIRDRASAIGAAGIRRLVGLPLAPHFSTLSVGAYHRKLREAMEDLEAPPELILVDDYHDHPKFIEALAGTLIAALGACRVDAAGPIRVLFTAHSLPERIVKAGEPYRDQLLETARLVAVRAGVAEWEFAFQSASPAGEPWLGPDILETIRRLASDGRREILVQPVGFVADHLEILYDLDILCRRVAEGAGARLRRTESLNSRPTFIAALASIVRQRLEAGGAAPAAGRP
jgi:ferrochelatase